MTERKYLTALTLNRSSLFLSRLGSFARINASAHCSASISFNVCHSFVHFQCEKTHTQLANENNIVCCVLCVIIIVSLLKHLNRGRRTNVPLNCCCLSVCLNIYTNELIDTRIFLFNTFRMCLCKLVACPMQSSIMRMTESICI